MCLVDGKKFVVVQIISADHKLVHFNALWCHLFHVLSTTKGMIFFQISPSKYLTILALVDRAFPPIKSTKNQLSPFITTKTVAYIFALIIDSVTFKAPYIILTAHIYAHFNTRQQFCKPLTKCQLTSFEQT